MDKRVVKKIGAWRFEIAKSDPQGQIRTVLFCWKGADRKKQFRLIQYRSGNISCTECVALRCLHIRKALKTGLFDKASYQLCLEKRGVVLARPKEKPVHKSNDLIDIG